MSIGNLLGHIVPGAFLVTMGCYWTVMVVRIKKVILQTSKQYVVRNTSIRFLFSWKEPFYFIIPGVLFLLGAVVNGFLVSTGGWTVPPMEIAHQLAYAGYALAAMQFALMHFFPHLVPHGADYFIVAFGQLAEAFGLHNHSVHHQRGYDLDLHKLLIASILVCFFAVVAESYHPESLDLKLFRSFAFILQGSWLVIVGTIRFGLFGPFDEAAYKSQEMEAMMTSEAATLFLLTAFASIGVIFLIHVWILGLFPAGSNTILAPNGYFYAGWKKQIESNIKSENSSTNMTKNLPAMKKLDDCHSSDDDMYAF